jgi:hypothetical protein
MRGLWEKLLLVQIMCQRTPMSSQADGFFNITTEDRDGAAKEDHDGAAEEGRNSAAEEDRDGAADNTHTKDSDNNVQRSNEVCVSIYIMH